MLSSFVSCLFSRISFCCNSELSTRLLCPERTSLLSVNLRSDEHLMHGRVLGKERKLERTLCLTMS